jgi:hypothetical protein
LINSNGDDDDDDDKELALIPEGNTKSIWLFVENLGAEVPSSTQTLTASLLEVWGHLTSF